MHADCEERSFLTEETWGFFACRIEYHRPILEKTSCLERTRYSLFWGPRFLKILSGQFPHTTHVFGSWYNNDSRWSWSPWGFEVVIPKLRAIGSSKTVFEMFLLGVAWGSQAQNIITKKNQIQLWKKSYSAPEKGGEGCHEAMWCEDCRLRFPKERKKLRKGMTWVER